MNIYGFIRPGKTGVSTILIFHYEKKTSYWQLIIKDPTHLAFQIFSAQKSFNDIFTPYYIFVLTETSWDQYFSSIYTWCHANEFINKSCSDGRLVRLWSSLSEARIYCFPHAISHLRPLITRYFSWGTAVVFYEERDYFLQSWEALVYISC